MLVAVSILEDAKVASADGKGGKCIGRRNNEAATKVRQSRCHAILGTDFRSPACQRQ